MKKDRKRRQIAGTKKQNAKTKEKVGWRENWRERTMG